MRIIPHTWRCCFLLVLFRLLRFFPSLLTLWCLGLKGFLSFLLLQFRELGFHLDDQHLELLFTLLAGVSVDIAGVLFAVWPFGGISSLKEMVVDFGDTARPGLSYFRLVRREFDRGGTFLSSRAIIGILASVPPILRSICTAACLCMVSVIWL